MTSLKEDICVLYKKGKLWAELKEGFEMLNKAAPTFSIGIFMFFMGVIGAVVTYIKIGDLGITLLFLGGGILLLIVGVIVAALCLISDDDDKRIFG